MAELDNNSDLIPNMIGNKNFGPISKLVEGKIYNVSNKIYNKSKRILVLYKNRWLTQFVCEILPDKPNIVHALSLDNVLDIEPDLMNESTTYATEEVLDGGGSAANRRRKSSKNKRKRSRKSKSQKRRKSH